MQIRNRLFPIVVILGLLIVAGGCDKKGGGDSDNPAAVESKGHPVWGEYDLSSKLKILQGKSIMKLNAQSLVKIEGMRKLMEDMIFEVKGSEVTITAEKGETVKGAIKVKSPCEVEFTVGGQPKAQFQLVQSGKDAWFGLGGAGTKLGSGYIVCVQFGFVTYDGKKCTYHKSKVGRQTEFKTQEVKCSLEGEQFKFQIPKFMKEGEFEDKTLKVVGEVLLSEQMETDHKVRPAP
ncbi:MAG: hypothetical protein JRJ87_21620 [Deltaproteobacteria bacterium]|nr:hypothetical protein [Deltaproteobacteria bacterium]